MSDLNRTLNSPPHGIRQAMLRRLALAAGLLAVVAFGLVFPFPVEGRLSGEIFDLAHAPVFCGVLICLIAFFDPAAAGLPSRYVTLLKMSLGRVILVAMLLTLVGLTGEYLQRFSGRSPSWLDVAANSAGLLAGLCWIASRTAAGLGRAVWVAGAIVVLTGISWEPALNIRECLTQTAGFPKLASFERPRELGSWVAYRSTIQRSDAWASDGESSLAVELQAEQWSGAAMIWFPRDWSRCGQLQLDLHNPGDVSVTVFVKVFDQQHTQHDYDSRDRFQTAVPLSPGATQSVTVDLQDVQNAPAVRQMNMQRIWVLEFFVADLAKPATLHLDHLRLTPLR